MHVIGKALGRVGDIALDLTSKSNIDVLIGDVEKSLSKR